MDNLAILPLPARFDGAYAAFSHLAVLLSPHVLIVFVRGIEQAGVLSHQLLALISRHPAQGLIGFLDDAVDHQADAHRRRPEDTQQFLLALPQRLLRLLAARDVKRYAADMIHLPGVSRRISRPGLESS